MSNNSSYASQSHKNRKVGEKCKYCGRPAMFRASGEGIRQWDLCHFHGHVAVMNDFIVWDKDGRVISIAEVMRQRSKES